MAVGVVAPLMHALTDILHGREEEVQGSRSSFAPLNKADTADSLVRIAHVHNVFQLATHIMMMLCTHVWPCVFSSQVL